MRHNRPVQHCTSPIDLRSQFRVSRGLPDINNQHHNLLPIDVLQDGYRDGALFSTPEVRDYSGLAAVYESVNKREASRSRKKQRSHPAQAKQHTGRRICDNSLITY